MSDEEQERVVNAWLAFAEVDSDTPEYQNTVAYQENVWAYEVLIYDLIIDDPNNDEAGNQAWNIIQLIAERPMSDKAQALFAAGPVEDLLAYRGEAFIDRVEEHARVHSAFNHLLGGVWKNAMSDAVWARVQTVRNAVW